MGAHARFLTDYARYVKSIRMEYYIYDKRMQGERSKSGRISMELHRGSAGSAVRYAHGSMFKRRHVRTNRAPNCDAGKRQCEPRASCRTHAERQLNCAAGMFIPIARRIVMQTYPCELRADKRQCEPNESCRRYANWTRERHKQIAHRIMPQSSSAMQAQPP